MKKLKPDVRKAKVETGTTDHRSKIEDGRRETVRRCVGASVGGKRQAARRRRVTYCDRIPEGVLLYTKRQMSRLLQVSLRCLDAMMQRGEVSYLKINGRMVRFRVEDVNRRLNETSLVWNQGEG